MFLCQQIVKYPEKITPYELWHREKPDFRKSHILGSTLYLHLHDKKYLGMRSELVMVRPLLFCYIGIITPMNSIVSIMFVLMTSPFPVKDALGKN